MSLGDKAGEGGEGGESFPENHWVRENIKTGEFTGKPVNFPHENVNNNIFKMYLPFYNDWLFKIEKTLLVCIVY